MLAAEAVNQILLGAMKVEFGWTANKLCQVSRDTSSDIELAEETEYPPIKSPKKFWSRYPLSQTSPAAPGPWTE